MSIGCSKGADHGGMSSYTSTEKIPRKNWNQVLLSFSPYKNLVCQQAQNCNFLTENVTLSRAAHKQMARYLLLI